MGIPRGSARLLLEERRREPFTGTVLQLGRSSVYFTRRELERWARWHRVTLAAGVPTRLSHDPRLADQGCIDDATFFELLGFSSVESCDIAEWEGATHLVDLNRPIPAALEGRADVVFETGTSIQIFDLPQVLENVHRFLKPGGRAIHAAVPSNNHIDLGFYMASPTLFADYYAANGYRLDSLLLCQYFPYWHRGRLYSAPWKIYRYTPGCLDHLSYGRFGGRQVGIFVVATRLEGATGDVAPQLGQYRKSWQHFAVGEAGGSAGELPPAPTEAGGGALRRSLERRLTTSRWLDGLWLPLKRVKERLSRLRPPRLPPVVARY
jgi:hypothetical protein